MSDASQSEVDGFDGLNATDRTEFRRLLGILLSGLSTLEDKPEETPQTALRTLWLLAAGQPVSAEASGSHSIPALDAEQYRTLEFLIGQRLRGIPLAHLTARQHFMGLDLLAGPQALIPRRETELLGWAAVDLVRAAIQRHGSAIVLDACTGSGNIAIGIAHAVPEARVFAADLSQEAVDLARRNVAHLGLGSRVDVRQGDLLGPFDSAEFLHRVDVLVCNPPYISSGKVAEMPAEISEFEPKLAFDGGPFGIRILHRLIQESPKFLRPQGWLAFEVGAGQGPSTIKRLHASGHFDRIEPLNDESGGIRAIRCRLATT